MELGEIISDALSYPFQNIKALLIYVILGIIFGIAVAATYVGVSAAFASNNAFTLIGSGIIGTVISLILGFIITGYQLDIIKYGIVKSAKAPGIDVVRQFFNGAKYFVVNIVYMIIPIIIGAILAVIFQHWLSGLISAILSIIFAFALLMAECRLAKTEDLGYALAIGDAIGDISRVGALKVILLVVILAIVSFVLLFVVGLIIQWNSTVGGILLGILGVYIVFFHARAVGLLYSAV